MTIKVFVGYHAGDDKGFANCEILDNKMENGVIREILKNLLYIL